MENYQIIKEFGQQRKRKFGRSFLALDKVHNRTVVLKLLEKSSGDSAKLSILREKEFSFDIQGLPKVISFQELESGYLLVKKYEEGLPLDVFFSGLNRKNHLVFLKRFIEKLSVLLGHLHEGSIIHCDLKPGNILVHGTLEDFSIAIIDFGLALRMNEANQRKIVFPLGFAAPELILNKLTIINPSTDIFSVGIIIWRLLEGKLPLSHPNPSIFTNLQLVHPLPNGNNIPKDWQFFIHKCCVKPQFENSPNNLPAVDVENRLILAQNQRFRSVSEMSTAAKALSEKARRRLLW